MPILARYDGQRPLVPWLIRVFQNRHLSELRKQKGEVALPEEDIGERDLYLPEDSDARWHEQFREAARRNRAPRRKRRAWRQLHRASSRYCRP